MRRREKKEKDGCGVKEREEVLIYCVRLTAIKKSLGTINAKKIPTLSSPSKKIQQL